MVLARPCRVGLAAGTWLLIVAAVGCRTEIGGGHRWKPDPNVSYFAPGPEFKLSREAAAAKAFPAERKPSPSS